MSDSLIKGNFLDSLSWEPENIVLNIVSYPYNKCSISVLGDLVVRCIEGLTTNGISSFSKQSFDSVERIPMLLRSDIFDIFGNEELGLFRFNDA